VQWREVPGYNGRYSVSSAGAVWSHISGRRLAASPNAQGYPVVGLTDAAGKQRQHKVHSLVLGAFVGPRPKGLITRHINGNPADNRLTNLEWATSSVNNTDTVEHGRNVNAAKTHCKYGHAFTDDNTYVYKNMRKCRKCAALREALRRQCHGVDEGASREGG